MRVSDGVFGILVMLRHVELWRSSRKQPPVLAAKGCSCRAGMSQCRIGLSRIPHHPHTKQPLEKRVCGSGAPVGCGRPGISFWWQVLLLTTGGNGARVLSASAFLMQHQGSCVWQGAESQGWVPHNLIEGWEGWTKELPHVNRLVLLFDAFLAKNNIRRVCICYPFLVGKR